MSEKLYLIKFDSNYADEFDLDGHCVLNKEQYQEFKEAVDKDPSFEMSFGTNESIDFEPGDRWSSAKSAYTAQEITLEEYLVLESLQLVDRGYALSFVEGVVEAVNYCRECESPIEECECD